MMVPMQTGTKEPVLWPVSITEKRKQFKKKSLFWLCWVLTAACRIF